MPKRIPVEVGMLGGKSLILDMDRQTQIVHLKHKLAEVWGYPPESLTLIHGEDQLKNSMRLDALCKQRFGRTPFTCIVSSEDQYACIANPHASLREKESALRVIAGMAHLDPERAVTAFADCLSSWPQNSVTLSDAHLLRAAAVGGLIQVGKSGDEGTRAFAMSSAFAGLRSPESCMRSASVEVLGHIATAGDTLAVDALHNLVMDTDGTVRRQVVYALGQVASRGDGKAVAAVVTRASDKSAGVRTAAAHALGQMLPCGKDADALVALRKLASDGDQHVKNVAERSLLKLLKPTWYRNAVPS